MKLWLAGNSLCREPIVHNKYYLLISLVCVCVRVYASMPQYTDGSQGTCGGWFFLFTITGWQGLNSERQVCTTNAFTH